MFGQITFSNISFYWPQDQELTSGNMNFPKRCAGTKCPQKKNVYTVLCCTTLALYGRGRGRGEEGRRQGQAARTEEILTMIRSST